MIKLLTIEVSHNKETNEIVYIANVIANLPEDILVLKNVIEDNEATNGIHCYGIKLHHAKQFYYLRIPEDCTSGQLYIQCQNLYESIPAAIHKIAAAIQSFIL